MGFVMAHQSLFLPGRGRISALAVDLLLACGRRRHRLRTRVRVARLPLTPWPRRRRLPLGPGATTADAAGASASAFATAIELSFPASAFGKWYTLHKARRSEEPSSWPPSLVSRRSSLMRHADFTRSPPAFSWKAKYRRCPIRWPLESTSFGLPTPGQPPFLPVSTSRFIWVLVEPLGRRFVKKYYASSPLFAVAGKRFPVSWLGSAP